MQSRNIIFNVVSVNKIEGFYFGEVISVISTYEKEINQS